MLKFNPDLLMIDLKMLKMAWFAEQDSYKTKELIKFTKIQLNYAKGAPPNAEAPHTRHTNLAIRH
ncbi:hypothetical protein GH754_00215 [Salinibacillus xinjiangensis]|uniref:Uncharacterized protein n=1 Tax=Salinibacillus xinjiangensis TaxID=1229268 RepID=A0A6G1X1D4_9BACI|nr:hypothetical protein [Salinibacillus xinjiangensis]